MNGPVNRPLPAGFARNALVAAITIAMPVLASAQEARQLPTTQVGSQNEESYKVDSSSTKFSQPLINTPRTINIVPATVLQDQGVTNLGDALRNVAGVSTFGGGEGGGGVVTINDKVTIRGFDARDSIYVDGVRDIAGYSRDMFNYEQLEVIKGGTGSVVGKAASGGAVNLSTKHARLDNFGSTLISYDELDTKRLTADYNAQINERVAGRVNVLYTEGGDRFDNGVENYETNALAGSLLFSVSDNTSITLDALYMTQDNTPLLGIPFILDTAAGPFVPDAGSPSDPFAPGASGTGGTGLAMGALPEGLWDNYYGVRGRDFEEVDTSIVTVIATHRVNDTLTLRNQTRWATNDNSSVIGRPTLVSTYNGADSGTNYGTAQVRLDRLQMNKQDNELFVTAFDALLTLDTGSVHQDIVAGIEYFREEQVRPQLVNNLSYFDASGNPLASPQVDLLNPSQAITVRGSIDSDPNVPSSTGKNWAVYLFDTLSFGENWQVDLNGRYDSFDLTGSQFIGGGRGQAGTFTPGLGLDSDYYSWGAALSYKLTANSNVYVSYSDANQPPGTNLTFTGNTSDTLDPQTSDSYEIGGKWQTEDQRLIVSGAYFVTTRTVQDNDVNGNPFIGGEQESSGFELSVVGAVTQNLSLTASLTTLDAEIKQDTTSASVGNGLAAAPDTSAALWGTYMALDGRLTLGAGLNYSSGDTYWRQNRAYFDTGSYTEVQAMAAYQITDNARIQLNINNLTDTVYVADYSAWNHFLPNTPRNMKVTFNYNF